MRTFVHFDPQAARGFCPNSRSCQAGIDPYYRDLVRINIDTGEMCPTGWWRLRSGGRCQERFVDDVVGLQRSAQMLFPRLVILH